MKKPYKIIELYKALSSGASLLPKNTGFDFWDNVYDDNSAVFDREFAREYSTFEYDDFMEAETLTEALADLKSDVLSVLTINQKKYAEMYRVFLVEDADDPITYNYDMTETTGAQHSEVNYGARSETKGEETFTKGAQSNTEGEVTNTHNVAPNNVVTGVMGSNDVKSSQTFTDGQRLDTSSARTDTELAHKDETDTDAWTLTRRGNIGVQTAGDILRIHTEYWTETYKFMRMIFDDINIALLMVGD